METELLFSSGSMGEYTENEGLMSSPLSTHLPVLVKKKKKDSLLPCKRNGGTLPTSHPASFT